MVKGKVGRRVAPSIAALVIATMFCAVFPTAKVWAHKVDCAKVMTELRTGKKPKVVASDLGISRSSVYRCRRKARAAAKSASHAVQATSHKVVVPPAMPATTTH